MRPFAARVIATPAVLILALVAFVAAFAGAAPQGLPPQAPPAGAPPAAAGRGPGLPTDLKGKLAVQAYKNIQVLSDIPADQLLPSMVYIAAALNVRCDHCHVQGQFDSDEKKTKEAARAMIRMVNSINGGTFNGQRKVTCYTCHRGSQAPVGTPTASMTLAPLPPPAPQGAPGRGPGGPPPMPGAGAENAPPPPGPPMPSVNDVLAKYAQALGGEAAIQKLTTRLATGTLTQGQNPALPIEESRQAPDMAAYTLHTPRGDNMQGYNGSSGWSANPMRGSSDVGGDDLVRLREWAEFVPGLHLKDRYPRVEVDGIEKIDGRDVYRVLAYRENEPDRFYFDKDSGLLVRFYTRIESLLGDLPQETTFDDYRAVAGVKVPFTVRVTTIQNTAVYKWDKIEPNTPADVTRFAKPNIQPAPPPPAAGPGGPPQRP